MVSLVGSLADNKAALGRRYAEWARERADARVRRRRRRDGAGRARPRALDLPGAQGARRRGRATRASTAAASRLALLDDELPDWTSFIAANLLVDGVLTTFVAACVDSRVDADGRSARRRSSRRRARTACTREAWAQAAVPRGGAARRARRAPAARPGSTPGAGSAPTTTPAYARRARGRHGHATTPPHQREQVRDVARRRCSPPRASTIALDEPTDWSRLGPRAAAVEP